MRPLWVDRLLSDHSSYQDFLRFSNKRIEEAMGIVTKLVAEGQFSQASAKVGEIEAWRRITQEIETYRKEEVNYADFQQKQTR